MSANHRGWMNRWINAIFRGDSNKSTKKNLYKRLSIEGLETRENPAFNLTIGGGVLTNVTQTTNGGVLTLTANATGANIPTDVISNWLARTGSSGVTISNGSTGTEVGNITWTTNPLDCAGNPFAPLGLFGTLTIGFDPSTTTGQMLIADNMIVGDAFNAVRLTLDTSQASSTPTTGGGGLFNSQLVLGAIDNGLINLTTKASTDSEISRISALQSISLSGQFFVLFDHLFAGASPLQPGNISIGNPQFTPGVQLELNTDSQFSFQATGTLNVNSNMVSSNSVPVFFQSNLGTQISGQIGVVTPTLLGALGPVTLSGPGPVGINGKITADSLLIDPVNPNFNLTLAGGANILNQINTEPTTLNNNGTLSIGSAPSDYYLFGSGFQSNSLETPINVIGTIGSNAAPISIGNLTLQGNSGIDTTAKNVFPLGANIALGTSKGQIIGGGTTPTVTLTLNSGTTGNISVVPVLQNIAQVTINNANQANFTAAANLGTLTVNNLTAGNNVTFASTATISTINLGTLGANSAVVFSKTATIGQITSKSAANYSVKFNAAGTVAGPLSGNVSIVKGGATGTLLKVAGATGTYTGTLIINSGTMAINSNFSANPLIMNGGALVGSGSVGVVTTAGSTPKTIQPGNPIGNFTVNTVTLGTSTQLVINLQSANQNANGRLTSTNGVTLSGASLDVNLVNTFFPANGSTYTIINNQSTLPTTGTFFGLPEGGLITIGGATFSITYAGGDGNDVILTTVRTGNGNQGYVQYLYSSILNRAADAGGLASNVALLNAGVSRITVVNGLWTSAEHRALQVRSYYTQFLGRAADSVGLAFYTNAFLAGAKEETVMTYFLTSGEYQVANPPVNSYITGLFNDLLGRNPSTAELNNWRGVMYSGVSRANVVQAFLFSNEYLNRTINGFYNSYLGHPGNASGLGYWVAVAQANRSQGLVAVAFLSSSEAFASATGIG